MHARERARSPEATAWSETRPTNEKPEGSFMRAYHYVCNSQSLCKCRELQVKGPSRGAGPKTRCGIVEIIKYDSVWKVLGENLAHGIISSYPTWLLGPQMRLSGKTVLVANLLGEGGPNPYLLYPPLQPPKSKPRRMDRNG